MISWIYYGEQGVVYMFGARYVMAFRILICLLMVLGGTHFVETSTEVGGHHDAGHRRYALAEHPAHDPAREPGHARLPGLHQPSRHPRRRLCGRAPQVIESHS